LSSKTYIELHSKIKNAISAEMLPERNQYTYIVLLDADKGGKKIKAVEEKLPSLLQQYLSNYQ
jgi:5S rRNA maturation endonuclease (ribonuclease M5)